MRFMLLVLMILMISLPVMAEENLWVEGDHIPCTVYNPVDGVYSHNCNPNDQAWIDLHEVGLRRFHYQLEIRYEWLRSGRWDQYSEVYTLGGPSGVDDPSDTWDGLIPGKVWYVPKPHNNFRNLEVLVTQRDVGVPVAERSTGELKSIYAR